MCRLCIQTPHKRASAPRCMMGNRHLSSLQNALPGLSLPLAQKRRCTPHLKQHHASQKRPTCAEDIQTDLFSLPLLPPLRTHFLPEEIRLTRIPSLAATHTGKEGNFLYHITDAPVASALLQKGLPLNKHHPLMLTEQNGISAWLAKISEYIQGNASEKAVILRLRRAMVEDALEPDPDHTAEFASNCYLLSGNFNCTMT
ncbi:hypothetical protein NBRC106471_2096 [Acetobacter pasteurianus subsp. pasteurianus LMG 1262 = NBRC 106471]|nr:hypothetical protein NBRC106471_2096 [Acetobacter pasteurianus subsp. pasteurianus LMG 1262 = NBRC 106471]